MRGTPSMSTPAGWYTDPDSAGQQRYWDGSSWTDQRQPAAATPPPPPPSATAPLATHTTASEKKSHTGRNILLAILGVCFLLFAGCTAIVIVAASSSDDDSPGESVSADGAPRDGKFEFDVKSMECGLDDVGAGFIKERAKGQFCVVGMTVTNIGDEAQMFSDSEQYAYNADGVEYSADGGAGIALNKGDKGFLPEINPGISINVQIAYDIPADQEIVQLELHDSFLSDGITVDAP